MCQQKKRIEMKDLISIGIYTALYFIVVTFSNIVLFIIPGYSFVFIPIIAALLSGTIFMLMTAKVPKFGAITLMGSLMGLNFFIMGRFPGSLPVSIILSLLADLFASIFKYKNKKAILVSYTIFSFHTIGPVLPIFFFSNRYITHLIEQGQNASYIENAFESISQYTFFFLVFGLTAAAIVGGLFGQRMMRKHFKKAGVL